jgi:AraC-like DNA-binding protein
MDVPQGLGRLVILLKGELRFSYSLYSEVSMRSKQMFFLPVGHEISLFAKEASRLVLIRLDHKIHFCDSFRMEQLTSCIQAINPIGKDLTAPYFLPVKAIFRSILQQVQEVSGAGYNCCLYFRKKTEELFMMMRFCYTRQQLACFFNEIVHPDSHFAYKVVHNYSRYPTLPRLARFMGLAPSSFDRRFKKIFGQSCYKWMNQRRKQDIYHAITVDNENFKELSIRLGFSSPIVFNDYCKRHFKDTPGKIRQKVRNYGEENEKR